MQPMTAVCETAVYTTWDWQAQLVPRVALAAQLGQCVVLLAAVSPSCMCRVAQEAQLRQGGSVQLQEHVPGGEHRIAGGGHQVLPQEGWREGGGGAGQGLGEAATGRRHRQFNSSSRMLQTGLQDRAALKMRRLIWPVARPCANSEAMPHRLHTQAVTIDVEDLEEDASPEDMMLSYVSADKGKVRSCSTFGVWERRLMAGKPCSTAAAPGVRSHRDHGQQVLMKVAAGKGCGACSAQHATLSAFSTQLVPTCPMTSPCTGPH